MATVGALIINLALNTAGLSMGLAKVEGEMTAFEQMVVGTTAGSKVAMDSLASAQNNVVVATQRLDVAQLRLAETEARASSTASVVAAARARLAAVTGSLGVASANLNVAQLRLAETEAMAGASESTLAAARARVVSVSVAQEAAVDSLAVAQLRLAELEAASATDAAALTAARAKVTAATAAQAATADKLTIAQMRLSAANQSEDGSEITLAAAKAKVTALIAAQVVAADTLRVAQLRLAETEARSAASAAGLTSARATVAKAMAAESVAANSLNVAQLKLAEVEASTGASAATLAAAHARVTAAEAAQAAAADSVTVAEMRLLEVETQGGVAASTLAASRYAVRDATVSLSTAEARLAQSQTAALASQKAVASPALAGSALLVGLAILGIGAASVHAASTFEYQMSLVRTQAGGTAGEVNKMGEAILNLSAHVQQGPEALAKALFHIESVGIRMNQSINGGATALDVLTTAAKGAAIGNANLESVTNALIATVLSGIKGVGSMSEAMGTLNGIVGAGNLRMEDLAQSMSSGILSTAKSFGVSIQDVGAALATMSDQGIPAEEASTRLRITIALLGAPTKVAITQLQRIGLTSRSLADEMRSPSGLIGALKLLKQHMDAAGLDATSQANLLKTAFGGSRSSAGLLVLINSLGLLDAKLIAIAERSAHFAEDFAAEEQTATAHFRNLSAAIEVLKVRIGNNLMPVILPFVSVLTELAGQTYIVVPLFLAMATAISVLAAKAFVSLVQGLVTTILNVALMISSSFVLQGAMTGLTVDTDLLSGAQAALAETLALAAAAAAEYDVALAAAMEAMAGLGPVTAEDVLAVDDLALAMANLTAAEAGVATATGALDATLAATGPAAAGATVGLGGLAGIIGLLSLPITIFVVALGLLIFKFEEVGQGVRLLEFWVVGAVKGIVDTLALIPGVGDQFKGISKDLQDVQNGIVDNMRATQDKLDSLSATGGVEGMINTIMGQIPAVTDAAQTLVQAYGTSLAGVQAAAMDAGAALMDAMAKEILAHQDAPANAFKTMLDVMATSLSPMVEIARNVGILASKELADALNSDDPLKVAAGEATKKHAIERLDELSDYAYSAGNVAGSKWQDAFVAQFVAGGGKMEDALAAINTFTPDQVAKAEAAYRALGQTWRTMAPDAASVAAAMRDLRASLATGSISGADAAGAIIAQIGTSLQGLDEVGRSAGADLMGAVADGMQTMQDAPIEALKKLHGMLGDEFSTARQIALDYGILISQDLTNGLASQDPAHRAWAIHTREVTEAELSRLTGGAYVAGMAGGLANAQGLSDSIPAITAAASAAGAAGAAALTDSFDRRTPGYVAPLATPSAASLSWPQMLADAMKQAGSQTDYLNNQLNGVKDTLASTAAAAKSAMTTAFSDIKASAMDYFDAVHERNLQAIHDAHDRKNALIDAKEALNQAPVTAAQKALDFQRKAIEEWRLRMAVANAKGPEAQRDAILALNDFLAQKNIDAMQAEVDAQASQLDAQKKANDDKESAAVKAENKRYQEQKQDFARQLTALESFLKNHPLQWAKAQAKIEALLKSYGVSYTTIAQTLGKDYAKGILNAIPAAVAAAKAMSSAVGAVLGAGGDPSMSSKLADAAAAAAAAALAALGGGALGGAVSGLLPPGSKMPTTSTKSPAVASPTLPSGSSAGGWSSGGTIIFQVGDEKLGEIVDHRLAVNKDIYAPNMNVTTRTQR